MDAVDKPLLARRFGRRAATYDSVTPLQARTAAMLLAGLRAHRFGKPVRRIVELGCGTGRLTGRLAERFPEARITAIDLAPEMAAHARARFPGVEFVVGDAETWVDRLRPGIDLIVTNAAVQWFATPAPTLARYRELLNKDGCMAVATFGERTFRELRAALEGAYGASEPEAASAHLPDLPTADYWRRAFPGAWLRERSIRRKYPDARAFLGALQQAGAVYSGRRRRFMSRRVLRDMLALYTAGAAAGGGGVFVTYHVILMALSCRRESDAWR